MTNKDGVLATNAKKTLAIIASEECRTVGEGPEKRWWHIRSFFAAYASVLKQYKIVATSGTAAILRKEMGVPWNSKVKELGPGFQGVVGLAAKVAQREVRTVLWFQDPEDLKMESAENAALVRNCNLAGAHLLINAAAHLWALYRVTSGGHRYEGPPYMFQPFNEGEVKETVVLIAHDSEKPRMSQFVCHYRDVLKRFPRLLATSGTHKHIEAFMKEHVPPRERLPINAVGATDRMAHGPTGGDVLVADEIFKWYGKGGKACEGNHILHHVLFFADYRQSHAHEPDIRVLLKTCVNPLHRVNLILNSRMAEEWADRYLSR